MAIWYIILGMLIFSVGFPIVTAIAGIVNAAGDYVAALVSERIAIININLQKIQDALDSDGETMAIGFTADNDDYDSEEYEDD